MIVLPGGKSATLRSTGKYDEAEFLVGGKLGGKSGELQQVSFRMHEGYIAEVHRWVKANLFPYKSDTDLIRHAIVRHCKWLPEMEGEVEGSLLHELAQIDEVVARWRFQNEFVRSIDAIAEQVNATLQMPGGKREVERFLRMIRQQIESTRDGYFKGVYLKMFMDRFDAYMPRVVLLEYGKDDSCVIEFPELPDFEAMDRE